MKAMKITPKMLKTELTKQLNFFKDREDYKVKLRKAINKHGIAALPKDVQRTMPTDIKTLYELPWFLNLYVWFTMLKTSWTAAQNESIRSVLNVG